MRTFCCGERFEPVCDLVEALVACRLGHAGVNIGVLMGFAGNCRFQIQFRVTNRLTGRRVTDRFEILKMAVGMVSFAFGS